MTKAEATPFPVQAHLHMDAYAQTVEQEISDIRRAIDVFEDRITALRQSKADVQKAVRPVAGMPSLPILDGDTSPEDVSRIARMFAPRATPEPARNDTEQDEAA